MPTVRQASAAHLQAQACTHQASSAIKHAASHQASHQPLWVVSDTARLHHIWQQATTANAGRVATHTLMELTLVQLGACPAARTFAD